MDRTSLDWAMGRSCDTCPRQDNIKLQLKDIVSNCMVLGDKRKHLACIITLRWVQDYIVQG